MALIDKNNKRIEVIKALFYTNALIIREYENEFPNSKYIEKEIKFDLNQIFDNFNGSIIDSTEKIMAQSGEYFPETQLISWCESENPGFDYNYRFFVTQEQMNKILIDYRDLSQGLFEGKINPILPYYSGLMIYVNTFGEGVREMLENPANKILIVSNPNKQNFL